MRSRTSPKVALTPPRPKPCRRSTIPVRIEAQPSQRGSTAVLRVNGPMTTQKTILKPSPTLSSAKVNRSSRRASADVADPRARPRTASTGRGEMQRHLVVTTADALECLESRNGRDARCAEILRLGTRNYPLHVAVAP
jgi:hypothetical protein